MKIITVHPNDLTVLQNAQIMTATDYNILPDGSILLHIPSPDGYAKWQNDSMDFLHEAETYLQNLSVNKIKEWKPSKFNTSNPS